LTVILNASRKFRSRQQIEDAGETHGGRTLAERVQPWLAPVAWLLALPLRVAIVVGKLAIALAVVLTVFALGLLVLLLALPLFALASLAGRVARRQTSGDAHAQAVSGAEDATQPLIGSQGAGRWLQ
jgi:hypothetical protein